MARNAKNTRMCAGCMTRKAKDELIAIRIGQNGAEFGTGHVSGRSAYLCPDAKCMEKAIRKKSFARNLRTELQPDFYDKLREFFITLTRE